MFPWHCSPFIRNAPLALLPWHCSPFASNAPRRCSPFQTSNTPWHCSPFASNAPWHCSPFVSNAPLALLPFASNAPWHCSPFVSNYAPRLLAVLSQVMLSLFFIFNFLKNFSFFYFFCLASLHWHCSPLLAVLPPQAPLPFTVRIAPLAVLPSLSVMLCQPVSLVILQQHYSPFPLKVLLLYVTLSSLATVLVTRFYRQSSTIIVFQATLFS